MSVFISYIYIYVFLIERGEKKVQDEIGAAWLPTTQQQQQHAQAKYEFFQAQCLLLLLFDDVVELDIEKLERCSSFYHLILL